jgi:hypothetical protein
LIWKPNSKAPSLRQFRFGPDSQKELGLQPFDAKQFVQSLIEE